MKQPETLPALLIAPCGMNCGLCIGYLREKNKCAGCNSDSEYKPKYCKQCVIKNCAHIKEALSGFCYECPVYPCRRLKQLDKRYRTKYRMSMIENLTNIKTLGLDAFVNQENQKWTCANCQARLSVHREHCLACGEKAII